MGRKRSGKVLITLRLEEEIVEYYRSTGPGYLQLINDILKRSMWTLNNLKVDEDA